jgi:hypothetical protein
MLALLLSACGAVLPGEGPSAEAILKEPRPGEEQARDYLIIPVSDEVITAQLRFEPKGLRATFGPGSPKGFRNKIGIGDVLQVYIWEAADNGLFSTTENKSTQFPPMQVDKRGRITIPLRGRDSRLRLHAVPASGAHSQASGRQGHLPPGHGHHRAQCGQLGDRQWRCSQVRPL